MRLREKHLLLALSIGVLFSVASAQDRAPTANLVPPVRAITKGPGYHWFGYYDKLQFDPTQRYVLGMETDFESRSPTAEDKIKIGMVDLADDDRWIELGESNAWGWQQGCMLQWRPGSKTEVVWNDREGEDYVCRILDIETRKMRTLPRAIYTISPDGKTALCADFRRINDTRPGYGYAGAPDPNKDDLAPFDAGIHFMDLENGKSKLIVSISDVAAIPYPYEDLSVRKNYFNHLLFNTDGSRFLFLHRWLSGVRAGSHRTRALTAAADGSDIRVMEESGRYSHFIWRDPRYVLAWAKHAPHGEKFFIYDDNKIDEVEIVGEGVMTSNGHCTYLPGNEWILNDTYPDKKTRVQQVYLYHVPTGRRVVVGDFPSPKVYKGEWRVDTHPRFSPDGSLVCIDSAHEGKGRQLYLIDIGQLVSKERSP